MISTVVHIPGQVFEPLQRSLRNMRLNDARELGERAAVYVFTSGCKQANPFNDQDPDEKKLADVWAASFVYMLEFLTPEPE